MLITKELVTKGSAILGSAGAGSTGIYYGSKYVSGLNKEGSLLMDHVQKKKDNYVIFKVQKSNDEDGTLNDLNNHDNQLAFTQSKPFTVKVTASSLDNINQSNSEGGSTNISDSSALTCSFRFEVEGNDYGSKTIKQDHKKRIFWIDNNNSHLGLFGLLSQSLHEYINDTANGASKWTKEEIFEVKNNFTTNCASGGNSGQGKEIVIRFKKEDSSTHLVPSNEAEFDKWFLRKDQIDKGISFVQGGT